MAVSNFRLSKLFSFGTLLTASIALLLLPQPITQPVNHLFLDLFGPFLRIGRQLTVDAAQAESGNSSMVPRSQYNQLWKEKNNLSAQLTAMRQQYEQISRVRTHLNIEPVGIVLAQVTASRPDKHELVINVGRSSGVAKGSMVLSPEKNSVVGIVSETGESLSRVRLITDPIVSMNVHIRRDGTDMDLSAQMFGDGKQGCVIHFIPRDTDIRKEDTVYASVKGQGFSAPIVVGTVIDIVPDEKNPLLWSIRVGPIETMTSLTQAVVLVAPQLD